MASFRNFFERLQLVQQNMEVVETFLLIYVNILQGTYLNADMCFIFGKYESLSIEICL